MEPMGQTVKASNSEWCTLHDASILHFCPSIPRLPQEDRNEDYDAFKFSLHCGLLPRPVAGPTICGEYTNQTELRIVVSSSLIGRLMGTGGSTIRQLRQSHQSSIFVSGHRLFHPDAVAEQGRVIHCSARDHASLCSTVVAIAHALYSSLDGAPAATFSFYVVIPVAAARPLIVTGGQLLARLGSSHQTELFLRAPHKISPSERLLAVSGPLKVLPALISSLLSAFSQPFQYTSLLESNAGPRSGESEQHMNCALDLPLNVVAQRYKRKAAQQRADNHTAKRAKVSSWRRPKGRDRRSP